MRKPYLISLLVGLAALFVAAVSNSGGPPASHTGAPGERTCATPGCHGSVVQSPGRLTIRFGDGLTEYSPGQTYTITVELVEPERNGRMGFQLTALNASNQRAGTLATTNADVRLITGNVSGGQRQYVMQSTQGNRTSGPNTRVWTFNWTAPAAATGAVTFYAAGLGANGNGNSDSGDRTYTTSLRVSEQAATPPTISIGSPEATYCQGEEFSLNFTTSAPLNVGNTFTLELSNSAGSFANPVLVGQVGGTGSGRIDASLPAQQAAGDGYRFRIRSSNPEVVSEPSSAFRVAVSPDQPLIAREGNTLSVEAGFATYQWLFNGLPVAGASESSYTPDREGVFSVRVANADGCTATSEPFNFTFTARSTSVQVAAWSVYPNPASESLSIKGMGLVGASAYLYDSNGRLVLAQPLTVLQAEARIDLVYLPAGVYQLQVRDAKGQSLGSRSVLVR